MSQQNPFTITPAAPAGAMNLPRQIEQLEQHVRALKAKIRDLENTPERTAQEKAEAERDEIDRRTAERQRQIEQAAAAALMNARAAAIRAIARLLPQAVAQAKKGKPALLRMILRATR